MKEMYGKIENMFEANVLFEASIAVGNCSYLLIYGRHINGYYICLPNWKIGCEAADPAEVSYNADKLVAAGLRSDVAMALAKMIKDIGGCYE